jgi:hypothetical protein
MNKYDEIIIKYFDEQLSVSDREKFERELEINEELKDAFENYKIVNELFSNKEAEISDRDYFNGIVPRFRKALDKKTFVYPVRKIGFTFATILLIISSYLLVENYLLNESVSNYSIESITNNLSTDEMNELANYISDDYWNLISSEEKIKLLEETDYGMDDVMADLSVEESLMILSDYQINDVYLLADEEELEIAYNEILNKRIY